MLSRSLDDRGRRGDLVCGSGGTPFFVRTALLLDYRPGRDVDIGGVAVRSSPEAAFFMFDLPGLFSRRAGLDNPERQGNRFSEFIPGGIVFDHAGRVCLVRPAFSEPSSADTSEWPSSRPDGLSVCVAPGSPGHGPRKQGTQLAFLGDEWASLNCQPTPLHSRRLPTSSSDRRRVRHVLARRHPPRPRQDGHRVRLHRRDGDWSPVGPG